MKDIYDSFKAVLYDRVTAKCKKTETTDNFLLKEKRNNGKPTHKTAHLQAPTHKPMLQLAKELFSCHRSVLNLYI